MPLACMYPPHPTCHMTACPHLTPPVPHACVPPPPPMPHACMSLLNAASSAAGQVCPSLFHLSASTWAAAGADRAVRGWGGSRREEDQGGGKHECSRGGAEACTSLIGTQTSVLFIHSLSSPSSPPRSFYPPHIHTYNGSFGCWFAA